MKMIVFDYVIPGTSAPAALFEVCRTLDCEVTVQKGSANVDAKQPFALYSLDMRAGDRISVTLRGGNEQSAMEALAGCLYRGM